MLARTLFGLLCLVAASSIATADTIALKSDHPDRYVVVKGDTLWDISARFLRDPWVWPKVWRNNPQIANPHLIYPGDVVTLTIVDGQPQLQVTRPGQAEGIMKLSPQPRTSPLDASAIPSIPLDQIQPFLTRTRIISERELMSAGYIFATDEGRLIAGSGNKIYARNITLSDTDRYIIFRSGETYYNPGDEDNPLGYEALYIGEATLLSTGDPAVFRIEESKREILSGDQLLPIFPEPITNQFIPRAPDTQLRGQIISILDGVSRIGQYQTIVLNLGEADGLETGHVLTINQTGKRVRDTVGDKGKWVQLPDEQAGVAMVFRVFENVSYALVMEATKDMRLYDGVTTP